MCVSSGVDRTLRANGGFLIKAKVKSEKHKEDVQMCKCANVQCADVQMKRAVKGYSLINLLTY